MYRDQPQRSHHQAPRHPDPHERKEWDHIATEAHDLDDDLAERNPGASRAHRADDARRDEAVQQIRELRTRY